MQVFHQIEEYRSWRKGLKGRVGFVPTMGALHVGHGRLLEVSRAHCDHTVLSIFVNPTQFGPGEDFERYPRTLESDLALARERGVNAVFAPSAREMYGPGYPQDYTTFVEETSLSAPLCGVFRPGHFRGVTTVVQKLFQITRPDVAYFGLKDAQQYFVLHRMGRDLNLDLSIEGIATVREPDGLALSSRNRYLAPEERAKAVLLNQVLTGIRDAELDPVEGIRRLEAAGFRVQYLERRSLPALAGWDGASGPGLVAVAAYMGQTRLIDNQLIRPELLAQHGFTLHL